MERRRRTGGLCLSVLLAAAVAIPASIEPALAHEDLGLQVERLDRRIADAPDDAGLRLRRADLHRMMGNHDAAAADLLEARRLEPSLAEVDLTRAELLFDAKDHAEALSAVDRYLAGRTDRGDAQILRGRILAALGRADDAVAAYDRGIAASRGHGRGPQPDHYLARARLEACRRPSRLDAALRGLDEGLAVLGNPISLQLEAVDYELARGNWDGALGRLGTIERGASRKETWLARRGDVLSRAGREREAREAYEAALAAAAKLPPRLQQGEAVRTLVASLRRSLEAPAGQQGQPVLVNFDPMKNGACAAPHAAL